MLIVKTCYIANVRESWICFKGFLEGKNKKAYLGHVSSLFDVDNRARNMRCFEGVEQPLFRIKSFLTRFLFD